MKTPHKPVLVVSPQSSDLDQLRSLLGQSRYCVEIANSEDQAVAQVSRSNPCLIILAGNERWSRALVSDLRSKAHHHNITIVALVDCHASSWPYQEDNPGFDGFLVSPLSNEIFNSLVQSASARQACLTAI